MARPKKNKELQDNIKIETSEVDMSGAVANMETELESVRTELDIARLELTKAQNELEARKKEIAENARRPLTKEEVEITERQITRGNESKAKKAEMEAKKVYDNQKVTGRFMNRRAPGQEVKLTYMHYADDPVKWYTFEDGKVYTIPRGFADEINEYYHRPNFIQKQGEMDPNKPQSAIHDVDTSNKIYAFVPVNF